MGEAPAELNPLIESYVLQYRDLRKSPIMTHESAMRAIKVTNDLYETVFSYGFDPAILNNAILTTVYDLNGNSYTHWSNFDESLAKHQNENVKQFLHDFHEQGVFGKEDFNYEATIKNLGGMNRI
jgi:hypothetical protein